MLKPSIAIFCALSLSACSDVAAPGFEATRYILVSLAGKPLPSVAHGLQTIADTLYLAPSQNRAQQRLIFQYGEKIERAVTELGLLVQEGRTVIDFHCINSPLFACIGMYVPEYGTQRGDTLEFVALRTNGVTRTYVAR